MSRYRFLEMVPGILAWGTLGFMVLASRFIPAYVAVFIILFDAYWFFKTIYFTFHLHSGFEQMRRNLKVDWFGEVKKLGNSWEDIYHLIILPMYKEPYSVMKESFRSLSQINYPLEKLIVVLGTEERAGEEAARVAETLKQEVGGKFHKFLITVHPKDLPGEIPGKGSNETWAAKEAKRLIIDPMQVPYENVLVSAFDADTQVFPEYFGRLTYVFLTSPNPHRASYQPISFFTNNIYEAPIFARIISFASTFWHIMNQARPEKLVTFSSHSMPFKALVEIGFWKTNHVSEDSIIFFQCYLHYNGDWRVVPLGYPVSMDSNVAHTFWETLKNVYKQQRRWGWGAENVPFLIDGFLKNKTIPLKSKIKWSLQTIDSYWEWATNAILIFALGWLPLVLGGEAFEQTLLSYSLPEITRNIMLLSSVGIVSSAVLSILLLPPRPTWFRPKHYILYILQWLLMPVTLIVFGAIPGLEAQTRLMLGGKLRLGFWPTPKTRAAERQLL